MIPVRENLCYGLDSAFSFLPYDAPLCPVPTLSRRQDREGPPPWQHPPSLSTTAIPRHPITGLALTVSLLLMHRTEAALLRTVFAYCPFFQYTDKGMTLHHILCTEWILYTNSSCSANFFSTLFRLVLVQDFVRISFSPILTPSAMSSKTAPVYFECESSFLP